MNRNKFAFTVALTQSFLMTLGFLNSVLGQDEPIVRALPNSAYRVASRLKSQDPIPTVVSQDKSIQQPDPVNEPGRFDQQESPSDQPIRAADDDLKTLQNLNDQDLETNLADDKIASLFKQGQWPRKGIRAISLDIREPSKNAPEDIASKLLETRTGQWSNFDPSFKMFCWAAPDIRYQPLYFEDVPLERYGQTNGTTLQTVKSAFRFYTSVYLLPYHMRRDPPGSCDYPLGFCRPGDDVPYTIQRQLYGASDK